MVIYYFNIRVHFLKLGLEVASGVSLRDNNYIIFALSDQKEYVGV